jgi:hypothetical protein
VGAGSSTSAGGADGQRDGAAQNETVAQTTTDTIELAIRLLQRYELIPWDDSANPGDPSGVLG